MRFVAALLVLVTLACSDSAAPPATGTLIISATTQLAFDLTPFAYRIRVDSQTTVNVGSDDAFATFRVGPLRAGKHFVELLGLAPTCTSGADAREVYLNGGDTLRVAFAVQCSRRTGDIVATASTTGADIDPDGYVLTLDDVFSRTLSRAGQRSFLQVLPGTHTIRITDVEDNCTLSDSPLRSVSVVAARTSSLSVGATCSSVPAGTEGFSTTDAADDTLPNNSGGTARAIDLLRVNGRYTPGWFLLVLHFSAPVVSSGKSAANSLYGLVDFDIDESAATGVSPGINRYGGSAQQGAEYEISFGGSDTSSATLLGLQSVALVGVTFLGDSVVIRIPLSKLGGDDGNMTLTAVFGTADRPTDMAPNSGVMLVRRPTAAPRITSRAGLPLPRSAAGAGPRPLWPSPSRRWSYRHFLDSR